MGKYVAYHAVAREVGVGVQDAVCGRIVTSSVHGIGASLVKRRLYSPGSIAVLGWRIQACLLTGNLTSLVVAFVIVTMMCDMESADV
jgi:hypothetical protein